MSTQLLSNSIFIDRTIIDARVTIDELQLYAFTILA